MWKIEKCRCKYSSYSKLRWEDPSFKQLTITLITNSHTLAYDPIHHKPQTLNKYVQYLDFAALYHTSSSTETGLAHLRKTGDQLSNWHTRKVYRQFYGLHSNWTLRTNSIRGVKLLTSITWDHVQLLVLLAFELHPLVLRLHFSCSIHKHCAYTVRS